MLTAAAALGALKIATPSEVAYADLPKVHVCMVALELNGSPWTEEQVETLLSGANDIWAQANVNITWNGTLHEVPDPQPPPAGAGVKGDIQYAWDRSTNAKTAEPINATQTTIRLLSNVPGAPSTERFQVDHEIRIDGEYLTVKTVGNDEITVNRGQHGTEAAEHLSGSSILIRGDPEEHGTLFETAPPEGKSSCLRIFFVNEIVDNLGKRISSVLAYANLGLGLQGITVYDSRGEALPRLLAHELGHMFGLPHPNPAKPGNLMGANIPRAATLNGDQIAKANANVQAYGEVKPGPKPTIRPSSTPTSTPTPTTMPTDTPTNTPTQIPTNTPASTPTQDPTNTPEITPTQVWTSSPMPSATGTRTPTLTPLTSTPTSTPTSGSPASLGDVNCDDMVDALDALWILWLDALITDALPCPDLADLNEDGIIDARDALWILWLQANLI